MYGSPGGLRAFPDYPPTQCHTGKTLHCSFFYRPPSSNPDLLDDICTYFNSIDSALFVIVGDFNVDMSTCFKESTT